MPENWLADEVLWGIVETPLGERWRKQWKSPNEDNEIRIMNSLWNQASVRFNAAESDDPKILSEAAWNIGKLAAGATSHVVHFGLDPMYWNRDAREFTDDIWRVAKRVVGSIKPNTPKIDLSSKAGGDDYGSKVEGLAMTVENIAWDSGPQFPTRNRSGEKLDSLVVDAQYLAQSAVATWIEFIRRHDGKFTMEPGGLPCSSGRDIEKNILVFDSISRPWAT